MAPFFLHENKIRKNYLKDFEEGAGEMAQQLINSISCFSRWLSSGDSVNSVTQVSPDDWQVTAVTPYFPLLVFLDTRYAYGMQTISEDKIPKYIKKKKAKRQG